MRCIWRRRRRMIRRPVTTGPRLSVLPMLPMLLVPGPARVGGVRAGSPGRGVQPGAGRCDPARGVGQELGSVVDGSTVDGSYGGCSPVRRHTDGQGDGGPDPLNTPTPAETYTALPKAHPVEITPDHDYRLRTDKVGTNGKTTLRWNGKLRRLYIGRRWGGEPITMVCVDNHVDIKITATGAQIAAYTLTEEKIYYNKKDNELNLQRGN